MVGCKQRVNKTTVVNLTMKEPKDGNFTLVSDEQQLQETLQGIVAKYITTNPK